MSLLDINRITHYITIVNGTSLVPRIWVELVAPNGLVEQPPICSAMNPLFSNTGFTNPDERTAGAAADHPFGAPIRSSDNLLGDASQEDLQLLLAAFPTNAAAGDGGFFDPPLNYAYYEGDTQSQLATGFAGPFLPEDPLGEHTSPSTLSLLLMLRLKDKWRYL